MSCRFTPKLFQVAVVFALVAGCAHHIDWKARVGHYTFDQAVTDLGPPDKRATLSDGRLVAEWISRYGNNGTVVVGGGGFYGRPAGVGYVQTPAGYYEDKLRLTFGTNLILTAWSKN